MGVSTRRFVATASGRIEKISSARVTRVWLQGESWPEYAGQELKMLEVSVEVDRTRVLRVLRVLPYRTRLDAQGRPDPGELWRAQERIRRALGSYIGRPPTIDERIAHLQADASYFWEPTDSEWSQAAVLLGVPAADLKGGWQLPSA